LGSLFGWFKATIALKEEVQSLFPVETGITFRGTHDPGIHEDCSG
jgi:hypothetical protein